MSRLIPYSGEVFSAESPITRFLRTGEIGGVPMSVQGIMKKEERLYWDSDRYIDKKTGQIVAMVELKSGYCELLMNGEVRAQFLSSAQAKRWVEEQNL